MTLGRRRFLQLSAAAAAPLVAAPVIGAVQRGADALREPIVVVGAGLAGLRAATLIRAAGRAVVVLEAASGPGGRVRTVRKPFEAAQHAEAGPIRIAGSHASVLALVQAHGLNLIPFESSNGAALVRIGGVTVRADALKDTALPLALSAGERGLSQGALLERFIGRLPSELSAVTPTPADWSRWSEYDAVTWPQWLRARGASDAAVALMTLGGDSRDLSALYVLRQYALLGGTNQFYKIQGGMDQLPRAMAADLGSIVRYGAEALSIEQTPPRVRVHFREQGAIRSIAASRVVLAVPFSIVRRLAFQPMLTPDKWRAVNDLPYFPAVRVLLQARTRFWHGQGLSGRARTDRHAEIWDCTYDQEGTPGILGATMGSLGAASRLGRDGSLRLGQEIVGEAFPDIGRAFRRGVAIDWATDRWARGAFAVFHPRQMTAMMPGISTPEGRVHFAGEHTSGWMGWMEGALRSGERAASEVLT